MRKMMKYGKTYGGTNPELVEDDIFRMIINVPEFGTQSEPEEVTPEVTPEVRLLNIISGEMNRQRLQATLGLKDDEHFRKVYLLPALQAGYIEMTIPDKPKSSKQKYRLTDKGQAIVKKGQTSSGR